jgi:polyphosphate:AMP phosphotransferase
MFESAELGHEVDKKTYAAEVPPLREALLEAQAELTEKKGFAVVVLVSGVDASGKGDAVNVLGEWMDPRHVETHAVGRPSQSEERFPPLARFWRILPPKGAIGVLLGSWYTEPILERAYRRMRGGAFEERLDHIVRFERMLADEGVLLVKLWFHLTKKNQKKRLEAYDADKATRWRVSPEDWKNHAHYDELRLVSERALRETSAAYAPWTIVEATDTRYRNLTVGKTLLAALHARLTAPKPSRAPPAPPSASRVDALDVLRQLDLSKSLGDAAYEKKLAKLQARLNELSRDRRFRDRGAVVVFEGNDAAGKGGAIRRVTSALDARRYRVWPIAAPSEEERAQPYLWRFWRRVPPLGTFALFDRSWYGRVLVERVEGFCSPSDWARAYGEINDFEERLRDHGIVVVKLWLAISQSEQLARFHAREKTGFKRFKITDEDWRNRKRWPDYERAVCDMVERTSTDVAEWHLVEANDKKYARVKIMQTLCDRIDEAL